MPPLLQTIFLFLRLSANTFFSLAYNLFQCSQPLQTIYFQISPPPRSVKKLIQIVRPLEAREKEDHVVRGFMSLTQLLCVLCGRLHISTTANLATQKGPVVDRGPLWWGSGVGLGGGGCKMTSSVSVLPGSNVLH